jgi:hypothetical protein
MADEQILGLRCACGWESRGRTDDLVAAATEHGRRLHNMTPTRAEVLAMVVPVEELSDASASQGPGEDAGDARG